VGPGVKTEELKLKGKCLDAGNGWNSPGGDKIERLKKERKNPQQKTVTGKRQIGGQKGRVSDRGFQKTVAFGGGKT